MFKSYLYMCFVVPKQKMSDIDHNSIVFIATCTKPRSMCIFPPYMFNRNEKSISTMYDINYRKSY